MNTIRAAILVALAVGANCNDLLVGNNLGRIVFNETVQASPAIWRQSQKVNVNVSDQEIISSVVVTDNREDKDGEATIVEGGEGQQNVTIELKSPTVFRGFDFNVVVYAAEKVEYPLDEVQHPGVQTQNFDHQQNGVHQHPAVQATNIEHQQNEVQHPAVQAADFNHEQNNVQHPAVFANDAITSTTPENIDGAATVTIKDILNEGPTSAAPTDSIVKFVTHNLPSATENLPKDFTTDKSLKTNGAIVPVTFPKVDVTIENNKVNDAVPTNVFKDFDIKSLSTTETADVTNENTHEKMVMQNFDSISKELGKKIVFGIKNH